MPAGGRGDGTILDLPDASLEVVEGQIGRGLFKTVEIHDWKLGIADAVLVVAEVVCAAVIVVRMRLRDMLNPLGVSGG